MDYQNMSITEQLITYCNYCLNDVVIDKYENYTSCKLHKKACQRFLDDLERAKREDCPFEWREEEVEKFVKFASYFKHSRGELAGQPIDLRKVSWHLFVTSQIYGFWNKSDDSRRFKKSFIEVARKNAKTQLNAIMGAYDMSVLASRTNEIAEVYVGATKREQSKICFDECCNMIMNSKFKLKFKAFKSTNKLIHLKTGSWFKPLSKDDLSKGDGFSPLLIIGDEVHQWSDGKIVDLFAGAIRKNRLLSLITTAGRDLNSYCFRVEYPYAKKILLGEVVDDSQFCDILEIDDEDDVEDRNNWYKANPCRFTYPQGIDQAEEEYRKAKENPATMVNFLTKFLDKWVESKEHGYMNFTKWKKCQVKDFPNGFHTKKYKYLYVGFDLSSKLDLTSVSFVFPYQTEEVNEQGARIVKYMVYSHSFIANEDRLKQKIKTDKMPYDKWVEEGYISLTNTEVVSQSFVMDWTIGKIKELGYDIKEDVGRFYFDDSNASKMMEDLKTYLINAEGISSGKANEMVDACFQSARSLNECTKGFRDDVYNGNVNYIKNPVLDMAMFNAIVVTDNDGRIKIDKDKGRNRIDPVDATLFAYKAAMFETFDKEHQAELDEIYNNWFNSI